MRIGLACIAVESAIYVTCAVTVLAVSFCILCGLDFLPCLPYWVLGTYAIYATHQLVIARQQGRWSSWRRLQLTAAVAAIAIVVGLPLVSGELWLAPVMAGVLVIGAGYSYGIPLGKGPWRQLPVLKTLLPWLVAFAAIGLLPLFLVPVNLPPARLIYAELWLALLLLVNLLWCDHRDRHDDLEKSVRSLPVILGETGTRYFLRTLQPWFIAIPLLMQTEMAGWLVSGIVAAAYLELLLRLKIRPGERTASSAIVADGLLFAPAAGIFYLAIMGS